MKFPDNNEVISFIKTYGLILFIVSLFLVMVWNVAASVIDRIQESTYVQCKISDLEDKGTISLYKGKTFVYEDFSYNDYSSIEDTIRIGLTEKK
jgi:hypothetical protein